MPSATEKQPNSGVQKAVKQAVKAEQGSNNSEQQAAPKGRAISSGLVAHQAANGAAKVLGVMASMGVPGMENAHALSLGAGSSVQDTSTSINPASPAEPDAEAGQAEANVIRPAAYESSNDAQLASLNVPGMASNTDQPEK